MSTSPSPSESFSSSAATPRASGVGSGVSDQPPFRYTAALAEQIEKRWQDYWEAHKTFVQPNPGEAGFDSSRSKFYVLDMFPYPSGAGLHVGHPEGYTATDIIARFYRMAGYNVLHPMGWDAFGLPAEQYAIQTGIHPAITTRKAIETFRRQLKRFGFSYDWSREVGTIDPEYYRWTQWIFLKAYSAWFDPWQMKARPIAELEHELAYGDLRVDPTGDVVHIGVAGNVVGLTGQPSGLRAWHELTERERRAVIDGKRLAYLGETTVNWCPALGTVLANDEVIDGRSERGGHPVLRKPLRQWMFRITAYAERLLADLETLDWPESTKTMQREWIGKSEGAEIDFEVVGDPTRFLRVFTTRPDTIFGATYMVVAPEHPLVERALASPAPGVDVDLLRAYVQQARNRSEIDRQADSKEKTGAFTGFHAVNPATGVRIPIWTADYVLMGYGHGAIMAVPAHDERDYAFARKFNLPIRDVVYPRTMAVMAYYARHATAEEAECGTWKNVLADFLGLATTASSEPEVFAAVLEAVRSRREEVIPSDLTAELKAGVLAQRGQLQRDWIAAIEGMGFVTFETMKNRFEAASVFDVTGAAFSGHGYSVNSANADVSLNDLATEQAKARCIEWLGESGLGARKMNFKLRDWAFSRQRYWGEPFPIVYDQQGNHYPVSEASLPVTLPELDDYAPAESEEPMPLLGKARSWVRTTAGEAGVDPNLLPAETPVTRETNTMPGSAGSSWYFLRYCDPHNKSRFISKQAQEYWMGGTGVDLYVGGAEHAVGHLLYSRFWQKMLFDLGEVSSAEPFRRLFHQGLITAYSYQLADKRLVPNDQVEEVREGEFIDKATGEKVTPIIAKMSKSLKNVVNPDDIIAQYGADTFRLYEMYMGPLEASKPWNTKDTVGLFRLLQRIWRLAVDEQTGTIKLRAEGDKGVERRLHKMILKIEADVPKLAFNTAIGAIFEFVNAAMSVTGAGGVGGEGAGLSRDQLERFVLAIAPFSPHIAEEIWNKLGHPGSLAYHPFPKAEAAMAVEDSIEIPIQFNGKLRHKITVPVGLDKDALQAAALADERVQEILAGQTPKKVIVVPARMVNVVM